MPLNFKVVRPLAFRTALMIQYLVGGAQQPEELHPPDDLVHLVLFLNVR
jgi:hypothetical protein